MWFAARGGAGGANYARSGRRGGGHLPLETPPPSEPPGANPPSPNPPGSFCLVRRFAGHKRLDSFTEMLGCLDGLPAQDLLKWGKRSRVAELSLSGLVYPKKWRIKKRTQKFMRTLNLSQ